MNTCVADAVASSDCTASGGGIRPAAPGEAGGAIGIWSSSCLAGEAEADGDTLLFRQHRDGLLDYGLDVPHDPVRGFGDAELVRLASYGAPARRRASWRREWEAELAHGFRNGAAFRTLRRALLSFADALHVRMQMGSAASVDGRHVASTGQRHISSAGERRMSSPSDRHENCAAGLIADGRLAARVIRRDPWFAVLVFMTFGLGIGVNASVFAVADAVLFRELSLAEPERLVAVEPEPGASVSKAVLTALRERTGSFESLAGWSGAGFLWTDPQEDALLTGARGTADVFAVLGVPALHGRTLVTGDDAPGAPSVVVVSHAFWRARLGGSEDALGSTLRLNDVPHTVVGVMPATFEFPDGRAQLWTPLEMDAAAEQDWQSGYLLVVGRLRTGVDATAATADVRGALTALRADSPGSFAPQYGDAAVVERLQQTLNVAPRAPLLALLAAAFAVFLTACVNVGALLLARATDREAELAVRAALGGSRTRIARLLLVESLVFAVGGAIVGLLLAHQGVGIARALLPESIAGASRIALDTRVVAVAASRTQHVHRGRDGARRAPRCMRRHGAAQPVARVVPADGLRRTRRRHGRCHADAPALRIAGVPADILADRVRGTGQCAVDPVGRRHPPAAVRRWGLEARTDR